MTANSRAPASAESGTFTRLGPLPNSYTSDLGLQRMLGCTSQHLILLITANVI